MASNYEIRLKAAIDDESIKKALDKVSDKQTINFRVKGDKEVFTVTNKIKDNMGKITIETEQFGRKGSEAFQTISKNTKVVTGDTETLKDKLINARKSALSFVASFGTLTTVAELTKEMVESVKEMDSALTEYKKVSDLVGSSLDSFVDKASKVGDNVARTTSEMIEGATEFKKSGYSDDDALMLAEIAAKYQNVADEQISAGESASFIIAQMKAFNIESKDAIHVVDAINKVSNEYAVSSAQLADNLGNVSSTLAVSGTTYEETLGLAH